MWIIDLNCAPLPQWTLKNLFLIFQERQMLKVTNLQSISLFTQYLSNHSSKPYSLTILLRSIFYCIRDKTLATPWLNRGDSSQREPSLMLIRNHQWNLSSTHFWLVWVGGILLGHSAWNQWLSSWASEVFPSTRKACPTQKLAQQQYFNCKFTFISVSQPCSQPWFI